MIMMILFTIGTYIIYKLTKISYKKWSLPFLHPLLLSPILLIVLITITHVSANQYIGDVKWLTHMLGPATISFAVPIYKHFHLIKKYYAIILISITTGTLVAILTSYAFSLLINLKTDFLVSILPRSITTPIAMEVSQIIGGLPTLTTVFVIITGVIGGIIGPSSIKFLSLKSPIARGLALGMSAHGVGTNKAMEYGEQEATFSTLAMILAAWITLLWGGSLIPILMNMIQKY